MPNSLYLYASRFHGIFCFYFLFSYYFLLFPFYFQGISNRQVCGQTYHISGTAACIAYYMHPMLFLFLFFFTFNFFVPVIQFFVNWMIVKVSSPVAVRRFSSPLRITLYSSSKLFRTWIIKSSSDTLPFCPNSFIWIQSPSKWEIHSLGSLSIDSNLLLWNLLFSFSRDKAVCRAYILTSLSHATLQFPSRKSSSFAFFTSPKATRQQRM